MKNEKIRKLANNCIYTLLLLLAATALAFLIFFASSRNSANIALIYILALLLISQHTASYGYGIFSALFSVVCINCFFTYPYFARELYAERISDDVYLYADDRRFLQVPRSSG